MNPPIIAEETIKRLKTRHPNMVSQEQGGVRKISLGLLSPPSSVSSRSASSASSVEFNTTFVSVPTQLESSATFEFLGFEAGRAAELYAKWMAKPEERKAHTSMKEYAMEWANADCIDGQDAQDDWDKIMALAGIKTDVREAIMRPEHAAIRYVQPLSEWLTEIIETAYDALVDLNAKLLQDMAPPSGPNLRGGQGEDYTVPPMPGGHLALFKSVEFRRTNGCIKENGSVSFGRLESTVATDFARRGGLYFTHQLWVAKHYSDLIWDACLVADRRTIEIHVPLNHFVSMKTWELSFEDDDFKQLLYHSRREEIYPKELSKKRALYEIIHGPIGHTHNRSFAKMAHWSNITEKHQLQEVEDGIIKIAKQHVWIKEEAIAQLEEDCAEKAYLRKPEQGFRQAKERALLSRVAVEPAVGEPGNDGTKVLGLYL